MICKTIFILGIIIYGLARATQQGSIFSERNREPRHKWLDMPNEIHFYGWFEPIGIFMATMAYTRIINAKNVLIWLVYPVLAYFIYWLPYALLYCHIRRKEWFSDGQMYLVGWIKTKLVSRKMSYVLFVVAVALAYYL